MITYGEGTDQANKIDCYEGVKLTIGKYCSIGSGLQILSGTHPPIEHPEVVSQYPFHEMWNVDYPPSTMNGVVIIQNDVWIATDVSILEGVVIGHGSIIGAKSVVTKDVEPYSFIAGNPATNKYYRFERRIREKLLKIEWWNWDEEEIQEAIPWMKDVNIFIKKYG